MMRHAVEKAKFRRRWWQFRLRTLLLMLTLISVGLALMGIPLAEHYREQRIVAPIEADGGRVSQRFASRLGSSVLSMAVGSRPYMRVRSIENANATPIENLQRLDELHHLSSLALRGVTLSDENLKDIARIPSLKSLDISGSTVTDAGLQHLRGHKELSRLNVAGTPISDAALEQLEATLPQANHLLRQRAVDELVARGCTIKPSSDPLAASFTAVHLYRGWTAKDLRHLQRLPGLTRLYATNVSFTSKSIAQIGKLTSLEVLHVRNGALPIGVLRHLTPLTKLRSLQLESVSVHDEELSHIGAFSELTGLCLDRTRVTGQGLVHLRSLERLEHLSLQYVRGIYDIDLEALHPLKNLRTLAVPNARITDVGVDRLNKALPGLRVTAPEPSRNHVALGPPEDGDTAAQTAFWSGRYDQLQKCLESRSEQSDWSERKWLGHARQLAGDWPGAVAAYKQAIELLGEALAAGVDSRERERLTKQWAILVLLTGRAQLDLLNDTGAAIKTLDNALRFAPAANRPIPALAQEAAERIDGLARPHTTRAGTGQLWVDLMYPLTAHRHLAEAYEKAGDHVSAIECYTRICLCYLAYRAAATEVVAAHLAELWASLKDYKQLPAMPVFSVISENKQVVTLKPNSGPSRVTCWSTNAWNNFGLVPKPGYAIASLRFECDTVESRFPSMLSCWAGSASQHNQHNRVLFNERLDPSGAASEKAQTLEVDVTFDCDVLFVGMKEMTSVTIHATLRQRTGANDGPKPDAPDPRLVVPEDVLAEGSPFQCLGDGPHEFVRQRLDTTAMARLPDGRFIVAFGDDTIQIALTEDGETWDGPFPFQHNDIFPTRNPSLCVDDDGIVWMVYLSKRPSYDIYPSAPYYLYRTSSRDGHKWSQPKPIQPHRTIQYQFPPFLTREPRGGFRLFLGEQTATAAAPDKLLRAKPLYVPVRDDWSPQDVHAVFDDQGRCHIVYGDSHGRIHYSYADTDWIWRVNTRLSEVEPMHVHTPQLILAKDRVALLYRAPKGLWLQRGRLTKDGPRLGPAQQIASHRIDGRGARIMRDGNDVYLPLAARPPLLLRANVEDLLGE